MKENLDANKEVVDNDKEKFKNLSEIFNQELPKDFSENTKEVFEEYFQKIKNELNNVYDDVYDKDPGLAEGYTLEQHTSMVVNQFAKYHEQFKEKLPYYMSEETFLQMLSIHDVGKVSDSVQDLKKEGVEKKVWKDKEEEETRIIARDILEKTGKLDSKRIDIILEVIAGGSKKMDQLITGNISPLEMKEYLVEMSDTLYMSNPEDFFNILEVYLMCDAGAYTTQAVEDFRGDIGDERTDSILEEYKKGEEVQFAGLGVTKWFEEKDGEVKFTNNDRFGDHKMEDWIKETRSLLNEKKI